MGEIVKLRRPPKLPLKRRNPPSQKITTQLVNIVSGSSARMLLTDMSSFARKRPTACKHLLQKTCWHKPSFWHELNTTQKKKPSGALKETALVHQGKRA